MVDNLVTIQWATHLHLLRLMAQPSSKVALHRAACTLLNIHFILSGAPPIYY